jgi:hypothetical protein
VTDRALTWREWRDAMFEAYCDKVVAVILEIEDADVHPYGYRVLQGYVCELKSAVEAGDPTQFDRVMGAIRSRLADERAWADMADEDVAQMERLSREASR